MRRRLIFPKHIDPCFTYIQRSKNDELFRRQQKLRNWASHFSGAGGAGTALKVVIFFF